MGRLIDSDDVMRMLTKVDLYNGNITDAKLELKNVKTAYDVEKVVTELEKELSDCGNKTGYYKRITKAIDIVQTGGKKVQK